MRLSKYIAGFSPTCQLLTTCLHCNGSPLRGMLVFVTVNQRGLLSTFDTQITRWAPRHWVDNTTSCYIQITRWIRAVFFVCTCIISSRYRGVKYFFKLFFINMTAVKFNCRWSVSVDVLYYTPLLLSCQAFFKIFSKIFFLFCLQWTRVPQKYLFVNMVFKTFSFYFLFYYTLCMIFIFMYDIASICITMYNIIYTVFILLFMFCIVCYV